MLRRLSAVTMLAALVVVAPAAAAQPPAPLARAEAQTAKATSLRLAIVMSMRVAGQTVRFSVSGVERLKAHQASMVVDMSKLSPTVGKMQMIAIGSRYYIHYDALDKLRATRPQIKPWIVTDSAAAAGFDPWSAGNFHHAFAGASGYRLLGRSGGVSRYRLDVDLKSAVAANPQLEQLLARAGTAAGLLDKPVPVVLSVGSDGYLHRAVERIAMPVAGQSLAMTIDIRLSGFDADPGPILAPAADQVMTLAQFKRLANG
jgi:hypothetical protein